MAIIKRFDDDEQSGGGNQGALTTNVNPATFEQQQGGTAFGRKSGTSQRFQNLQKFIKANEPKELAQNVQKGIEQRSDQLRKGIEQSKERFQQSTMGEQQRLQSAPQTIQAALGNWQQLGQQFGNQFKPEDYSNLRGDARQQIEDVRRLRRGEAKTDFRSEDMPKQETAVRRFQEMAGLAPTESGRFQLLQSALGNLAGYTPGKARVDQLLLQTAGKEGIRELDERLRGIAQERQAQLQGFQGDIESRNQQLAEMGRQAAIETAQTLESEQAALQQSLVDKAEQYRQDIINRQSEIQEKMRTGQALTESDQQVLGLNPDNEFNRFYEANRKYQVAPNLRELQKRESGVQADISELLRQQGLENLTEQSVVGQEELGRALTLARLRELDPVAAELGQYGDDFQVGDFLQFESPEAVKAIEEAFKMKPGEAQSFFDQNIFRALENVDMERRRLEEAGMGDDPRARELAFLADHLNQIRDRMYTRRYQDLYSQLMPQVDSGEITLEEAQAQLQNEQQRAQRHGDTTSVAEQQIRDALVRQIGSTTEQSVIDQIVQDKLRLNTRFGAKGAGTDLTGEYKDAIARMGIDDIATRNYLMRANALRNMIESGALEGV